MTASKVLLALSLSAAAASVFAATPAPPLVKFEGAIAVDPLTGANGVDVVNTVRGIAPGGRAWVIRKLKATVGTDGTVSAKGAGLLLASGDVIGTRGPVTHVAATLACGAANATASLFTSAPSPLQVNGDFQIVGTLSQDGVNPAVMPASCDNPVLLIRAANPSNGVAGAWFAAGILNGDDD